MSKKANPALIGGFVIGALVLLVVGILLFGKGLLFTPKHHFVIYFSDSVNGLNVGAPVKIRGVVVGTVKDVLVQYDVKRNQVLTPVLIEFEPERVTDIGRDKRPKKPDIKALISRGLRAQLQLQSLVTGQLYVEVNFLPDTPVRLVGDNTFGLPEIPSIPSTGEEMKNTASEVVAEIRKMPLRETVDALLATIRHIDSVVASPEVVSSISRLNQTLGELQTLVSRLGSKVEPVASNLVATLEDTRKLLRTTNDRVVPLVPQAEKALTAATTAFKQMQTALATIDNTVGRQNPSVDAAMEELTTAAQSIRVLSDYLQRHPQALIYGKRDR